MRGFMGGVRSVQADLQSAVVEYQDLQSDYACFLFTPAGFIGILVVFVGRGSIAFHRLPIIRRHSVTLPAGVGVPDAAVGR